MVDALPHIHIRNFQPQLIAALVEARQTVLGNGGPLAMDESNAAVALAVCRADQRRKAGHVVRKDCHPVVEHVVDRDDRHIAVHQLDHLRVCEIHTGDHGSVHPAVVAVLQIGHRLAAEVPVDKGDIVAQLLDPDFEAVQHSGEVFVCQAALPFVHEQDADIISTVGLHGAGCHIGNIAHPASRLPNTGAGGFGDIRLAVERLAHRGHRDPAFLRQIFQG